ncbi:hypothetical protein B0H14DRAFT_2613162 [Mycena olivaceomarginata]|nr:hypothetical protein B0H14DRAFT_2613162 [Mycena olivaceomarginata]
MMIWFHRCEDFDAALCANCSAESRAKYDTVREDIWSELPANCGVEDSAGTAEGGIVVISCSADRSVLGDYMVISSGRTPDYVREPTILMYLRRPESGGGFF